MTIPLTDPFPCWYVNGQGGRANVGLGLTFENGQYAVVSAVGQFNIYRPTIVSYELESTPAVILDTSSDIYLGLGQKGGSGPNRMYWHMGVSATNAFTGYLSNVQLVNFSFQDDTHATHFPTHSELWLDTSVPYPSESFRVGLYSPPITDIFHSDTPSIEGEFSSEVQCSGGFSTYVQFQPDGGIPITIGSVNWGWHGQASVDSSGHWNLVSQGVSISTVNLDDDTFPEWPYTYIGN